ncbi:uncharacterized protein TERG_00639 [Trichophyton rubrum CBS 118892]|uniref:RRM domain-containing protein n=1 Tax=Trichophyton rubrum (strain ATCC MYA-4607 / CBS 118892) TaxID=559305 RepID=F2SCI4_TRIRC|nr:uncharacterized protein TERG_00639 [Trichophyton rubrum CBS 118892]EGD84357.1 hypothetical protein TERG_00639 [Trichophyton rubrum CBS 118892]
MGGSKAEKDTHGFVTLIKDPAGYQAESTTNGGQFYEGSTQVTRRPTQLTDSPESAYKYAGPPASGSGSGTHQTTYSERPAKTHTESSTNHYYHNDGDSLSSDDRSEIPIHGETSGVLHDSPKQSVNGSDNRTVSIKNVPDRATHRDITAAVRGGALVDVFLRSRDHMASVSFADTKAAQDFYNYAKRCNLCILDRPVDVSWAERQYSLSSYLASQMTNGASRNLIIRGVHPNVTEAMIREDMKHIHNLIIVSLSFNHGNVYISTNSVQKATFARNCMMSRMPYRIMRIEYYHDECADPLPKIKEVHARGPSRPTAKPLNPMANRFQMLHLDDSEEESDNQDEMEGNGPLGDRISWPKQHHCRLGVRTRVSNICTLLAHFILIQFLTHSSKNSLF